MKCMDAMLPHVPQDQPGSVDKANCPPLAGTEAFFLGSGENPCLLSMFIMMIVSSKQNIAPPDLVLFQESRFILGGGVAWCWLFSFVPLA
jgi:hypothetical protein